MASKKSGGVFAAVGAATGLGNAFRFPALCTRYGGAFILIYLAALIFVGFPLLSAELSFGSVKLGKRGRAYRVILTAATVNSALIALYYGGIATKLAAASIGYLTAGNLNCPQYITCLTALAVFFAVGLVLSKGAPAMGVSGKLCVVLSFALFIPLAALGLGQITKIPFHLTALASGAAWSEGIGQALLSLSLAAGVMPSFAASMPNGFSHKLTAVKIIFANLCGCIFALLATLPFASSLSQGGVWIAFTIFPQVINAVSQNALFTRLFGAFAFAALAVVAVHSLCSLAYPSVKLLAPRIKFYPLAFACFAVALSPLFAVNDGRVLNCCDRVACCVTAVVIALFESFCFAHNFKGSGVIGVLTKYACPLACIASAILSLCSARFNGFSALDLTLGAIYAAVPIAFAVWSGVERGTKRKRSTKRKRLSLYLLTFSALGFIL